MALNNSETNSQRPGLEVAIIGMAGRFPGAESLDQFGAICEKESNRLLSSLMRN